MDEQQRRLETYDKPWCWQYDIRQQNYEQDIKDTRLPKELFANLTVDDFWFTPLETPGAKKDAIQFIKRHEWLGTISQYTTHWFGAFLQKRGKVILAGVTLMNMPNAFSKMLGDGTDKIERLISRGACISWSPKNLASSFLMWSIRWMVENTDYRLFTAYADPTAKELGTIYQACNFYYLGQASGTLRRYVNPHTGKLVSDRYFRQKTAYKKFAAELGIPWDKSWSHKTGMNWFNMPDETEEALREHSKYVQSITPFVEQPAKHKYALVLGRDRSATKALQRKFLELNKTYPYPKERGK